LLVIQGAFSASKQGKWRIFSLNRDFFLGKLAVHGWQIEQKTGKAIIKEINIGGGG